MKWSNLSRYILALFVTSATLCGCSVGGGEATTPPATQGAIANSVLKYPQSKHAKGDAYIYVSGIYTNELYVYSYNAKNGQFGSEIGSTTNGISEPQGLCASTKGEAYVANAGTSSVLGYKAPSLTSNVTLSDSGEYPAGCSVDSKGDVAVSNIESTSGGAGNVVVYKGGTGSGTAVGCSNLHRYYFVGYDTKGDLWADGEDSSNAFAMCEIPAGKATGNAVKLNHTPGFPGGVQWWHNYLTVLDQDAGTINVYRVKHYSGKLIKSVKFGNTGSDIVDYDIFGKYVVLGNVTNGGLASYKFPAGGAPVDTLSAYGGLGVVVVK